MLSALALTLGATPQVSIDPRYASKLSPHDCQLFLTSVAVAKFNKIVSSETDLLHTTISAVGVARLNLSATFFTYLLRFSHSVACQALVDTAQIRHQWQYCHPSYWRCGLVIKDSKRWIPLQEVAEQLKKEFNKSSQVNIFKFAFITSLSAVAGSAGDGLLAANAKVAANISLWFSNLSLDN
ncbi:hypothetical protein G6F56_006284 [Rhizopus delemar]|nr:hypothetical protein G6F56_006284 [Rhizopus delemar]